MVLLGGASYAIYLLHVPVRQLTDVCFSHAPPQLAVPFTVLAVVGFSIFVFLHWEEPSRKVLRRWFAAEGSGFRQLVAKEEIDKQKFGF
jgi:peptidoglycan/LPS O-acetylase OafA/YrhL